MKNILALILCLSVPFGAFAKSEIRYMDDLVKDLLAKGEDSGKILSQFKSESGHKDPQTGEQLQKVLWIEKGSSWEKAGVKVGDFLANGKTPK